MKIDITQPHHVSVDDAGERVARWLQSKRDDKTKLVDQTIILNTVTHGELVRLTVAVDGDKIRVSSDEHFGIAVLGVLWSQSLMKKELEELFK